MTEFASPGPVTPDGLEPTATAVAKALADRADELGDALEEAVTGSQPSPTSPWSCGATTCLTRCAGQHPVDSGCDGGRNAVRLGTGNGDRRRAGRQQNGLFVAIGKRPNRFPSVVGHRGQ